MTLNEHPLMSLQLSLEEEMVESGSERFFRGEREEAKRGNEGATSGARYLVRALVEPLEQAIKAFLTTAGAGKPGRKHSAYPHLAHHKPAALAFLTLREGINSAAGKVRVQSAARSIAAAVENEQHLREMRLANPKLFRVVKSEALAHSGSEMRNRVAKSLIRKLTDKSPDARTELLIGTKLLDLAIEATGIFEVHTEMQGKGFRENTVLVLSEAASKRIAQARDVFSQLSPDFLPWVVPPAPWTAPDEGVSWSGGFRKLRLVRTRDRAVNGMLAGHDLSAVYEAVNAVQETPWRVNTRVLAVMEEAFDTERDVAGLPELRVEKPPFPAAAEAGSEALKRLRGGKRRLDVELDMALLTAPEQASLKVLKDWKKLAAEAHSTERKNVCKRVSIARTMAVAKRFSAYERIYFPHHLDFRGRMYPFCVSLSPQGADPSKALLTFAEGKPLDGVSAGWLAVHGANVWGNDKVSLDERVAWVEERNGLIREIAADPWSSPGRELWTKADKPWQFLAFCFEWDGFLEHGCGYVSTLPVAMDGSCNGLQHYSAALRDPVGGAAVNLVPALKPADIYATVAERTVEKVRAFLRLDGPGSGSIEGLPELLAFWQQQGIDPHWTAQRWLQFGIDRKITKRAVMTLPYGSTRFSCREFIEEAVKEKIKKGAANLWKLPEDRGGEGLFRAALWLQPFVWQSIGETVTAARTGMDWLQACAGVAASGGQPLHWRTPDGFVVRQAYWEDASSRVETTLAGRVVKLTIQDDTQAEMRTQLNKRRQAQGVAPNWVHSMDAAALRSYVRIAKAHGIDAFALVHDSYGSLAADCGTMLACLKEAFVDLYEAQDPLACFRVDVIEELEEERMGDIPPIPSRGSLDLSAVRQSDFFFA